MNNHLDKFPLPYWITTLLEDKTWLAAMAVSVITLITLLTDFERLFSRLLPGW